MNIAPQNKGLTGPYQVDNCSYDGGGGGGLTTALAASRASAEPEEDREMVS